MSFTAQLDVCTGPACPRCGCQDAQIVKQATPFGDPQPWYPDGRARCKDCGEVFAYRETEPAEEPEPERPPEAPEVRRRQVADAFCKDCGAKMKTTSSPKGGARYLKCKVCGRTGKIGKS